MSSPRPLITANMVTLARLLPMPIISWWMYGRTDSDFTLALVVGTIIGCTDFIDGYLARKHGPTVLGGLLDPIADKVFVVMVYTPFADMGILPAWAIALMFVRELLVTALRSAYEQRGLSLKTSYLAKAKTWTQMQGIGVLVLFMLVSATNMTYVLSFGIAAPLLAMAALWLFKKRFWPGALLMSIGLAVCLAVHLRGDQQLTMSFIMLVIVGITWLSGVDYVVAGFKQLRGRGDFGRADFIRIASSIIIPVALFSALRETGAPAWPLLAIMALELSVGGLDNLLSHHRFSSSATAWGLRTLGSSALLGVALLAPELAAPLTMAAAAVTTAGVVWEFWRGRDYYIDRRIRDKAIRGAAAA